MRHASCVLLLTACTTAGATRPNVLLTSKTDGEHFHTVHVEVPDRGGEKVFTVTNWAKDPLDALHTSGVALAEVAEVNEFDARGVDGDKGIQFKLKRVRGSGFFKDTIHVITEVGGLGPGGVVPSAFPSVAPPAGEVRRPSALVKPDSLKKGERYWFAFSSHDAYGEVDYQGVIAFWPEKDKVSELLEAAVKDDMFRWSPEYVPGLKLSYGHVVEKDKWRVRFERDGKILWEKTLPGKPLDSYPAFGLYQSTPSDFEVPMPKCGYIVFTESDTRLEMDNEFGLPAGQYYVNNGFDPESCGRSSAQSMRRAR